MIQELWQHSQCEYTGLVHLLQNILKLFNLYWQNRDPHQRSHKHSVYCTCLDCTAKTALSSNCPRDISETLISLKWSFKRPAIVWGSRTSDTRSTSSPIKQSIDQLSLSLMELICNTYQLIVLTMLSNHDKQWMCVCVNKPLTNCALSFFMLERSPGMRNKPSSLSMFSLLRYATHCIIKGSTTPWGSSSTSKQTLLNLLLTKTITVLWLKQKLHDSFNYWHNYTRLLATMYLQLL